MRTDLQRNDKYAAKTVAPTVSLKVASMLSQMKTGFSAAINSLVPIEIQIQGICNEAPVPTIQYPFYLNFGREIWSRKYRGITGAALLALAIAQTETYVQKGLDETVLIHIALDCFTLVVPPLP